MGTRRALGAALLFALAAAPAAGQDGHDHEPPPTPWGGGIGPPGESVDRPRFACGGHQAHWVRGGAFPQSAQSEPRFASEAGFASSASASIPEPVPFNRERWEQMVFNTHDRPSRHLDGRTTEVLSRATVQSMGICHPAPGDALGGLLQPYATETWWRSQIRRWTGVEWNGPFRLGGCVGEPEHGWIHVRGEALGGPSGTAETRRSDDGQLISAIIRMDTGSDWWRDERTDPVEVVLAHELGHVLGFWHVEGGLGYIIAGEYNWDSKEAALAQLAYQVGPDVGYPGVVYNAVADSEPELAYKDAYRNGFEFTVGGGYFYGLPRVSSGDFPLTHAVTPDLPDGLAVTSNPYGFALTFDEWHYIGGTPLAAAATTEYSYVVTDADGDTDTLDIDITVLPSDDNQPPVAVEALPDQTMTADSTLDVDVSRGFRDPDGDTLAYQASSSAPGVAAVAAVSGSTVTLMAVAAGTSAVTVTATDPEGLSAAQWFTVTVEPPENRPPVAVGTLPPLRIGADDAAVTVEVASAFRDPDGDALAYAATSSSPTVATAAVSGTGVTVTPVAEGASTVAVTATDPEGLSATQSFTVTVGPPSNRAPVAVGVLGPLTIGLDDPAAAVDVGGAFRDPDGDALTYGAVSSAPSVAAVAAAGARLTVTALAEGTAVVTVTATDPGGLSASRSFTVTVGPPANRPPEPVGVLGPLTVALDDPAVPVELAGAFRDPDGDELAYGAVSSAPSVAAVAAAAAAGARLTVTALAEGTAVVTVTATDPGGLSATQSFTVTVSPPSNRPPEPVGVLGPLTIGLDGPAATVDVRGAFRDPDGDALTYGTVSSAPSVAAVSASGGVVTVTPAGAGTAVVTVTATDAAGSNTAATQTFGVKVVRPFTDHPIVPGVTPVRAVHFTELRTRIDGLRAEAGLPRFAWTDPTLTAGVTPVRLAHLTELREALAAAYLAAGRPAPAWADAAPTAGATPIRASHVMDLRAAVRALE